MNPHNVETFAVSSIRRKGKRRIILTDSSDPSAVKRRTVKIPDYRMRDIKCFIKEYEGTLLISFDAPIVRKVAGVYVIDKVAGSRIAEGVVSELIHMAEGTCNDN